MSAFLLKPRRGRGRAASLLRALLAGLAAAALPALADPITNATVVNVTPASFSLFWRTSRSTPSIAVFADAGGVSNLTSQLEIESLPLHTGDPTLTNAYDRRLAQAVTRQKSMNAGLNLMRVSRCQPGTTYYYRITSTPISGTPSVYPPSGPLPSVTTETENSFVLNAQQVIMNVVGYDTEGYIVLLNQTNTTHPLAAVVGDGVARNQVVFNVSDLFAMGGGNFAAPGTQQFSATVKGTNQSDVALQFSLTFSTQLTIAAATQIGVTNEFVALGLGSTILLEGQNGSVPLNYVSSAGVGSLNLLLDIPPGHLTNFTLLSLAPQIDVTSVSITPQGGSTSLVHVATLPGQTLVGGQAIAQLGFLAVTNVPSAIVPLRLAGATAAKPDATPVNVLAAQPGRAVVIGTQPLLETQPGSPGARKVAVYGRPWTAYEIQYATNLAAPVWRSLSHFPLTSNLVTSLNAGGPNADSVFFRAAEFAPTPPVMDALPGTGAPTLLVFGRSGVEYTLQYTTNLSGPAAWYPVQTFTLTNDFLYLTPPAISAPAFYRLVSSNSPVAGGIVGLGLGSTWLLAGQTGAVPLMFTSTVNVASLVLTLSVPSGSLTNFGLQALAPAVDPASLVVTPQGGGISRLQIAARPGQSLNGAQTLAQLAFAAPPQAASAFVPLQFSALGGTKTDTGPVATLSSQPGQAIVIGAQPLVVPGTAPDGSPLVTLYAQPWTSYQLLASADLQHWRELAHFPVTSAINGVPLPATANQFYRVGVFTPDPPVVDALRDGSGGRLLLGYGRTGSNYVVLASTNTSRSATWAPVAAYTLTNSFKYITPPPNTNRVQFYRLERN